MEFKKILHITESNDWQENEINYLGKFISLGMEELFLIHKDSDVSNEISRFHFEIKLGPHETKGFNNIMKFVEDEKISIISINRSKGSNKILSHNIERFIRFSPVPIFIFDIRREKKFMDNIAPFDQVVFATALDSLSEKLIQFILNINSLKILEIVYVIDRKLSLRDLRVVREKLNKIRRLFLNNGIDAEIHIYAGKIPQEIILASKDYNCSSIIMGVSDRRKSLLTRSPSYVVARDSDTAVLFINRKYFLPHYK